MGVPLRIGGLVQGVVVVEGLAPAVSLFPVIGRHAVGKSEQPGTQRTRRVVVCEALVHGQKRVVGDIFKVVLPNAKTPQRLNDVASLGTAKVRKRRSR